MTPLVLNLYKESSIVVLLVPANMTNFLEPLDLTVNSYVKKFMHGKFNVGHSLQIGNQLDAGKQLQDIDAPLRLSLLQPCHAESLVEFYNHMTTTAAQKCHSKWVEGHRNHGSSSGWSQSIEVT